MADTYLLKKEGKKYFTSPVKIVDNPSSLILLSNPTRVRIVQLVSKTPMYSAEIARTLKIHEQTIYYHIKQLLNAGFLEVVEKKEIRGTIAKRITTTKNSFAICLGDDFIKTGITEKIASKKFFAFFSPFIENGMLKSKIIIGSPDPHGPFKSRARDGHYAIELALFLGKLSSPSNSFSVTLDVDQDLSQDSNYIVVGGPVTNLSNAMLNPYIDKKFSEGNRWGIAVNGKIYTDDSVGLISRIPNPFNDKFYCLIVAGVRAVGTKSAVIGLTRFTEEILKDFKGQKMYSKVVQGFDIDGDGKIDTIEVID
ncbi:MAG: ArsR/SmtB family transcription factor [Candidatus Methanofastidiosia archaeon]